MDGSRRAGFAGWVDCVAVADDVVSPVAFVDATGVLVAEPLACVQRIYDFAGLTLTPAALAAMKEWAVENARDRRPVHRYTLAEFGMTEEALQRDFAEYREKHLS